MSEFIWNNYLRKDRKRMINMGTVFKRTLKISLCFTLSALVTVLSIAAGSALDGAEENKLEIQTQSETHSSYY